MNGRESRLAETVEAIAGPLDRLGRSLHEDGESITRVEGDRSSDDLRATDAFLQRFQQLVDLALRKLFPRLLATLEQSDARYPFGAVLDRLDGFEVLADVPWWIALNELRNRLVHEYAMSVAERAEEMRRAWHAASRLHAEIVRIREDRELTRRLYRHD